jgi:hypothetical protein
MSDLNVYTTSEINALTPITGDLVLDSTLNAVKLYDGAAWKTFTNDATSVPYQNRWGASFDGTDDSFSTSTYNTLFSGAFTLSCWYKTPSTFPSGHATYGKSSNLLGIDSSVGTGGVEIRINKLNNSTNARIQLYYTPSQTAGAPYNMYGGSSGEILATDTWYHICWVADRDSSSATSYLYVDGSSVALSAQGGYASSLHTTSTAFSSTENLTIGGRSDGVLYAVGHIDDVAIFGSALDQSAVTDLYSGGTPDLVTGASGYWRMGDDSNDSPSSDPASNKIATITDSSGNGNDATQGTASAQPTFSALASSETVYV